jgi:hypothetical protein
MFARSNISFFYLLFRESISINPMLRLVKELFLVMAIPLTTLAGAAWTFLRATWTTV